MATEYPFKPHRPEQPTDHELRQRARDFHRLMDQRRTVRQFSGRPVPETVIDDVIRTASTAPSGAHKQPWTFVVVTDPAVKARIRAAAEKEEHENYHGRMPPEWLEDLAPLGTDRWKPFLEIAPVLIVVFKKAYDLLPDGHRKKNYYVEESVGIATGFLLAAIHQAGLASLTHTPSPMNFLAEVLGRPANERPFLLIPVGFAADDCTVPVLERKPLEQVRVHLKAADHPLPGEPGPAFNT